MYQLLAFLGLLLATTTLTAAIRPPDFVFIAVDDLNYYASFLEKEPGHWLAKVYPDLAVREEVGRRLSPNLDRLASESLVFTRAYCPSALCGPSRTALLSGVPPHLSGYYEHNENFRDLATLRDVVTLPQYLKANGYFTTGLGKIFHKSTADVKTGQRVDWPDMDHSWSQWVERPIGANSEGGRNRTLSPYSPTEGLLMFGVSDVDPRQTRDYLNAQFAAKLLLHGRATIDDVHDQSVTVELPKDRPYFLACGLFLPHLPWIVPQEFYDRFPVLEMAIDQKLIDLVDDDITDLPQGIARRFLGKDFDTLAAIGEKVDGHGGMINAWKAAVQAYLASYAFADFCLGQLIDAIEQSPQRDNTVVILWGDHGWHLGDKRRFRKQAIWDPANHTVLLVRDPGFPAATTGATTSHLVSLQDLYPTVVSRAGLPRPKHVFGRDLTRLLHDPATTQWEDLVLMTYNEGNHAIRTPQWRYLRYQDGGVELYDIVKDPFELTNLAGRPDYVSAQKEMNTLLESTLARNAASYINPPRGAQP